LPWQHPWRDIPEKIKLIGRRTILGNGRARGGGAGKPRYVIDELCPTVENVLGDDLTPGIRSHPGGKNNIVTQSTNPNSHVEGASPRCFGDHIASNGAVCEGFTHHQERV
jgi:hypothetical protein